MPVLTTFSKEFLIEKNEKKVVSAIQLYFTPIFDQFQKHSAIVLVNLGEIGSWEEKE